jgi:ATP-dependent DNA ligase
MYGQRRQLMQILQAQQCPRFPKIRGSRHNIRFPCYAELKYDGEANIYTQGLLISKSSGKIRTNCPATDKLSKIINDKNILLFGELYYGSGKFGDLYKFLSNQNSDNLKYIIFDVYHPTLNGAPYEQRREFLLNLTDSDVVDTWYCENDEDVESIIKHSKNLDFEGIVLKNKDSVLYAKSLIEVQTGWCKVKHKYTADMKLIMLDPVLKRGEVENPINGKPVGIKINAKDKAGLSVGDVIEVEHQGVLSGGSLRHPIFKRKREWKGDKHRWLED